MPDRGPLLGATLELVIGGPAHGGSCVARVPPGNAADAADGDGGAEGDERGRAVFVRHALPGERVRALVTEDRGGAYCFADAVEILDASPDRVTAPCPHAGPGACGGCDWQHASGTAQRALKETVVREQFSRLAHLDLGELFAGVEELPGGLLGWRTRNLYAVGRDGHPGMRRHRSHEIEPIAHCPLGAHGVGDSAVLSDVWTGLTGIETARGDGPDVTVLAHRPGPGRQSRGRRPPDRVRVVSGPDTLHHEVLGRDFDVRADGFWQVHPAAAATFAAALLDTLAPRPGETVLDLYAGAGALTAALAEAVGPTGSVVGLESSPAAVSDAAANLGNLAQAEVRQGRVSADSPASLTQWPVDLVVLDPPRSGAGREVMQALLALGPRAVGYVACDPAALARDVATARAEGWRLTALRAFDAFPMTHHVECVARLDPPR